MAWFTKKLASGSQITFFFMRKEREEAENLLFTHIAGASLFPSIDPGSLHGCCVGLKLPEVYGKHKVSKSKLADLLISMPEQLWTGFHNKKVEQLEYLCPVTFLKQLLGWWRQNQSDLLFKSESC